MMNGITIESLSPDQRTRTANAAWHSMPVRTALVLLLVDSQQSSGLGAESDEFLILGQILLHPCDGLVEPGARLFLVTELPVGHDQEESVEAKVLVGRQ